VCDYLTVMPMVIL